MECIDSKLEINRQDAEIQAKKKTFVILHYFDLWFYFSQHPTERDKVYFLLPVEYLLHIISSFNLAYVV